MFGLDTQATVIVGGSAAFALIMSVVLTSISRFYRRCGADEALVRTGSGGNKVVAVIGSAIASPQY